MTTENVKFNWSLVVLVIIGFIAATLFISTATAKVQSLTVTDNEELLVVTGNAEVVTRPDTAVIYANINTRLTEGAAESQNKNNEIKGWIIGGLEANGVPIENIQATELSVRKNEKRLSNGSYEFQDWQTSQTLSVRVPIEEVNNMTSHILIGDEVTIRDIQFIVANTDSVDAEARSLAIENAQKKAEEIAAEAGIQLKEIHDISEGDTRIVGNEKMYNMSNVTTFGRNAGQYRVTADMTVAYRIN